MYYVRVKTRSSGAKAKGTPDQAIDYITDGHDTRRDPGYSDAELAYIARMGQGWKTDLEGGRVSLVGVGTASGETEHEALRAAFIDACKPHMARATTGYKSFTFTVPKEVSLFAEGHREQAKEAMYAAVRTAFERVYGDKEFTGVAAIHTRNEAGEIHHHVHVLVGKFARDRRTGKVVSLNSRWSGNTGNAQLRAFKETWRDELNRELRERLGLTVEQNRENGPVALVMPDGVRLDSLNRNSRRALELAIAPSYTVADPSGAVVQKVLKFKVMDERIFEVAAGDKGKSGWDGKAFRELFPDQARYADRYEKRVETLKAAGYLTAEGKITPAFRVHYALRQGILTPELQRIRIDLAREQSRKNGSGRRRPARPAPERPAPTRDFWGAVDRHETLRRRVERLGYSREEVDKTYADVERLKPTPERLGELRARELHGRGERTGAREAPGGRAPGPLFVRAFVPPPRGRSVLTANATPVRNPDPTAERTLEDDVRKFAESFLLVGYLPPGGAREVAEHARRVYAREVELPRPLQRDWEPTPQFRPMVAAFTTLLPRNESIARDAVERCARIGSSEIIQRVRHSEMARAYREWREAFIARPMRELAREASALGRPEQQDARRRVEGAKQKVAGTDLEHATALFKKGLEVLRTHRPAEASRLERWRGQEEQLVRHVLAAAKSEPAPELPKEEFQAAVRAGRIGHLLDVEAKGARLDVPPSLSALAPDLERLSARLHGLGVKNPLGREEIRALAPVEIRQALDQFRREGVLVDGDEWALRGGAARRLAEELRPTIERGVEADQHLIDRLIAGRSRAT